MISPITFIAFIFTTLVLLTYGLSGAMDFDLTKGGYISTCAVRLDNPRFVWTRECQVEFEDFQLANCNNLSKAKCEVKYIELNKI